MNSSSVFTCCASANGCHAVRLKGKAQRLIDNALGTVANGRSRAHLTDAAWRNEHLWLSTVASAPAATFAVHLGLVSPTLSARYNLPREPVISPADPIADDRPTNLVRRRVSSIADPCRRSHFSVSDPLRPAPECLRPPATRT